MVEKTREPFSNDVPGSATARSRRATDRSEGLPMAQAALKFASARQADQYRAIVRAPFIAHPIEVARLLRCEGQADDVIPGGLLHDLLEKTATTARSSNAGSVRASRGRRIGL